MAIKLLRGIVVPMWCQNPQKSHKKFKQELKQKNMSPFKKNKNNKEKCDYFTFGKPRHYVREHEEAKWKPNKKSTNMVEVGGGTLGCCN